MTIEHSIVNSVETSLSTNHQCVKRQWMCTNSKYIQCEITIQKMFSYQYMKLIKTNQNALNIWTMLIKLFNSIVKCVETCSFHFLYLLRTNTNWCTLSGDHYLWVRLCICVDAAYLLYIFLPFSVRKTHIHTRTHPSHNHYSKRSMSQWTVRKEQERMHR